MVQSIKRLLALPPILVLLLLHSSAYGGITGKIAGTVVDQESGDPIEGATVRVLSTNLSTMTDADGEFFIINVPGGKYDVNITHVAYNEVTQTQVRVLVDLTSPVDFKLRPGTVELPQTMIVNAANPIIQRDQTESKITFTADQLRDLPNIVTVQSVLTNYPGVIIDANQALHVRGGRTGQVTYLFDGFSIQDPFISAFGLRVMPSALEELSLISGGFSAEYGEAMSGVVNAITREGGSEYHGGAKVYEGLTHQYDVVKGDWQGLDFYKNYSASFNLSGPIPGVDVHKHNFFVAGEYLKDPSYLPANQVESYTGTAKLTTQPMSRLKIKSNLTYSKTDGMNYQHRDQNGISYDFNLDGTPAFDRDAYLAGISANYVASDKMVLSTVLNTFYTRTLTAPPHLMDKYWTEWPGYSVDDTGAYNGTIHDDNYWGDPDFSDPLQASYFTAGDDFYPIYQYRMARYNSLRLNMINQINKSHQLTSGVEWRQYDVKWDSKQFFNRNPYGEKYSSEPSYASAYLQDKMEYDYFIINLGLRLDYNNSDIIYNASSRSRDPEVISGPVVYAHSESNTRLSPRFGVSFPITEKSMMHFNYGVYYQEPRYTVLYENLQGDVTTGYPRLGNPNLKPERTTAYELGLDHLVGDGLRLDITAYHKNIEELVTTRSYYNYGTSPVTVFDNDDYGTVNGLDIAIEKLPGNSFFSATVAYSFMLTEGNGSFAEEPYYTYITSNADTLPPVSSYPLDFDQRHTVTASMAYKVPEDWKGSLFGVSVPGNWGLSMVGHYGSGLPYTPTDQNGNRLGERNESRLPSSFTVDMRIKKDFRLGRNDYKLGYFVEVDNLFNRKNVLNVYSRTGKPDNDGNDPIASLSTSQEELDFYDRLYDKDPQNYSAPRTIRTGLEFNF